MGAGRRPTLIQSVQRALRLLEVVAEHDGRARAKELARATGLPLATTYHLLRTCTHEGWLQRLDDGSYVLGHRIDVVREHGTAARGIAHARPALEWLRDELGGAVYLARYVDGEIVVAEIVDSARAPRIDLWVGDARRRPRHRAGQVHPRPAAAGRARRLPGPPSAARPHPAHRRRPPAAAAARTGRLAVDDGEYAVGVCCLAAPVGRRARSARSASSARPRRSASRRPGAPCWPGPAGCPAPWRWRGRLTGVAAI